jgi:hypothetical protein
MEGSGFNECYLINPAAIWRQQGEITCIMASGKEDMFALTVIGEQAEHL